MWGVGVSVLSSAMIACLVSVDVSGEGPQHSTRNAAMASGDPAVGDKVRGGARAPRNSLMNPAPTTESPWRNRSATGFAFAVNDTLKDAPSTPLGSMKTTTMPRLLIPRPFWMRSSRSGRRDAWRRTAFSHVSSCFLIDFKDAPLESRTPATKD